MTNRYPYRHHGPAVHGSKLTDYLISEANMIEDIEQLRDENARLRELLSIAVEMTGEPECWYDHHGHCQAHNLEPKGECWVELSSAILSADPAPVGDEWQPIETAPRDGTWFWVLDDCDAISVRWHDKFQAFVASWREMTFAESYGGEVRLHSPDIRTPTYWMPQPKPPAGENGND